MAKAPDGATHTRRPEYLTAYLFEEGATDIPAWLVAKYVGGPIPEHRFDSYACAIDGEFWRWMDGDKFNEMFVAVEQQAAEIANLRAERDALQLELIAAKPLYSRRKLEAERDALALQVLQLTNERDDARARAAT